MAEYLRDLAERLMAVPVMYGVDQSDIDRLNDIARRITGLQMALDLMHVQANVSLDDNLGDE
jgi:hypothetical protein